MTTRKSRWPNIAKTLVANSIAAMFSAIEIHNKPNFSYRYETTIILLINARELIFKAYIYKNRLAKLWYIDQIWNERPKPFLDCLSCVKTKLWTEFFNVSGNIEKLYEYRCKFIHFYADEVDPIIFLLMTENIKFYVRFIKKYFPKEKLNGNDLIILPIGFQAISSPVDILGNISESRSSSKEVKEFIRGIIHISHELYEQWIEDGIITSYNVHLLNQNSSKTAEFVAKRAKDWTPVNKINKVQISNDPNAIKVSISYEEAVKTHPLTAFNMKKKMREYYKDYPDGKWMYNKLIIELKKDRKLCIEWLTNPWQKKPAYTYLYSNDVYKDFFDKYYKRK